MLPLRLPHIPLQTIQRPIPTRPIFSTETLASATPEQRQLYDTVAAAAPPPPPSSTTETTNTMQRFEQQLRQWKALMDVFREHQKTGTDLRKRKRSMEAEMLALMEEMEQRAHPLSASQSLNIVASTTYETISEKYLREKLPHILHSPEEVEEISQFLLSQRKQKVNKRLKVGKAPPVVTADNNEDLSIARVLDKMDK